jgi:hypothetical protein
MRMNNEIVAALLANDGFIKGLGSKLGTLSKADTISQGTNLLWFDLRPVVQLLFPFKELIPEISRLPRVSADGGNAFHWKRITAINPGAIALGVSEGNRGGRIAITEEDQQATYKTLGLESSVTFEARLGAENLTPDALGVAVQSTLRSVMIGEEQALILGNASTKLGVTPTPTLSAGGTTGAWAAGTAFVACVALSGYGWLNTTPFSAASPTTTGVPGQITKINADGSTDTFGGGSAQPSATASIAVTAGQVVTATVAQVPGAVAYAWFTGTAAGSLTFRGISTSNQVVIGGPGAATNQPLTALQVGGVFQDNSTNLLLPDGVLSQIFGSVFGGAPGTAMATNPTLPNGVGITAGGSLVFNAAPGNSGLTISGTNIAEFDAILRAAYDQYKLGFDRILMSAADIQNFMGTMLGQNAAAAFRIFFDADAETGRIVAGRRVTSYLNKWFGNTLDIEVHPFLTPGTVLFWSDRTPYELSGVPNLLEAHVRQDYYQIQWPFQTRRYEYGVYSDEVFACYFTPAFAAITNLNPPTGTVSI